MKNGKLQCKDIPTLPILKYVAEHGGIGLVWWEGERSVRNVMPAVNDLLALAKMRNLIAKGLVDGCSCGCRGDFEITKKGQTRILELEGVDPWPERWTPEALEAARERLRANPLAFARYFLQEPLPELSSQHMADILQSGQPLKIDLAASRKCDRLAARTQAMVDEITVLALSGTDVSGVKFVCSSEAQARTVMEKIRRRLGPLFNGLPTSEVIS